MDFKFDNIYIRTKEDGLLNLLFENLDNKSVLEFKDSRFSIENKTVDSQFYSSIDIGKGSVNRIKETDDLDYLLQVNNDIVLKIFFFPNDNYPNGVEQILKVYTIKDDLYDELISEIDVSDEAVIY